MLFPSEGLRIRDDGMLIPFSGDLRADSGILFLSHGILFPHSGVLMGASVDLLTHIGMRTVNSGLRFLPDDILCRVNVMLRVGAAQSVRRSRRREEADDLPLFDNLHLVTSVAT